MTFRTVQNFFGGFESFLRTKNSLPSSPQLSILFRDSNPCDCSQKSRFRFRHFRLGLRPFERFFRAFASFLRPLCVNFFHPLRHISENSAFIFRREFQHSSTNKHPVGLTARLLDLQFSRFQIRHERTMISHHGNLSHFGRNRESLRLARVKFAFG